MAMFDVDKSALPDKYDSPIRPNSSLFGSDQARDYWDRRESFESGGNVEVSGGSQTVNKSSGLQSRGGISMTPTAKNWVTENLGPEYVGKGYSTLNDMMESSRKHASMMSGLNIIGPTRGKSLRLRELEDKGLVDKESGAFNQPAIEEYAKKEKAIAKEALVKDFRERTVSQVLGTLPTAQKQYNAATANDPQRPVPNTRAYWESYYKLPPEARGIMQPGIKKSYLDIVNKALAASGM